MLSISQNQKVCVTLAPEIIKRELENAREYKDGNPAIADYYYERVELALHKLAEYEEIRSPSFYERKHYFRSARVPETAEQKALQQSIADVHFERGEVFSRLKQWDKAKVQYEKADKWGHTSAQEALKVLAQLPANPSQSFSSLSGLHKLTPSSSAEGISTLSARQSATLTSTTEKTLEEAPAFKFFLKNLPLIPPALPQAGQSLRNTEQLAYCLLLLYLDQQEPTSTAKLSAEESVWLARVKQDQVASELGLLAQDVIRAFEKDEIKNASVVSEVVALAPVYALDDFQKLLNKFITKLNELTLLDFDVLNGLAQMIRHAPPNSLRNDDLVKILEDLTDRLKNTHGQSEENQYRLAMAITQMLDAMADNKVTDLNREVLHQPLQDLFNGLRQSNDPYLVYQAEYAYQALAYVPDDETPWQGAWRRISGIARGVSKFASAVKAFDLDEFADGIKNLQEPISDLIHLASDMYEQVSALQESGQELIYSLREGLSLNRKHVWYPTLRGLDEIPADQLNDFKQKLIQPEFKACRWHKIFLWGLSERLARIAAHPAQAAKVRGQALQWLGELYEDDQTWRKHPLIQQRVVQLIRTLATDSPVEKDAETLLTRLKTVGDASQQTFYEVVCLSGPLNPYPLYEAHPRAISLSLLDKVQHKKWVETDLRRFKNERLEHWGDPLYVPPRGKASLFDDDTDAFDLAEEAEAFFKGDKKVALVLGESGAGKSTFLRFLEATLWENYRKGGVIPLFIALPTIDNPEQDFIEKHLRRMQLTKAQIKTLKETREFIVIADGYDECGANENLYKSNHFNQPGGWRGQLIIGCRSQRLGTHYLKDFQPDDPALFQEWVMAPFGQDQIDQYVEALVDKHSAVADNRFDLQHWQVQDYQRGLTQIDENFKRTPLLLKTALEVLPRLLMLGEQSQTASSLTRATLYDEAMKARFEREKQRLQGPGPGNDLEGAFNALDEHGFVDNCMQFVTELAVAIYEKNGGNPVVEYNPAKDKGTWKEAFFGEVPRQRVLRTAWPLIRHGNQYRFEHKSFLEYFVTRDIFQPQEVGATAGAKIEPARPSTTSARRGSNASLLSFESQHEVEASEAESLPDSLLTRRSLVNEPAIIQFLAERLQTEPYFKKQLHAFIERSKTDVTMRKAAANAMTILIKAGVQFCGTDLAGIQIPGADLSYGVFDSVQLQGADLRKVNLTGAWLRAADLTGARMENAQFGELPSLQVDDEIITCGYSSDGRYLAVATRKGKLALYEVETLAHLQTFEGHTNVMTSVAFSGDGQMLASGSKDNTVRLWSVIEKGPLYTFEGHTDWVNSVAFSKDGQTLASGSWDNTVRLWSIAEKKLLHTFEHPPEVTSVALPSEDQTLDSDGDESVGASTIVDKRQWYTSKGRTHWVNSVAFSPDGYTLASGSGDNMVRLWSVAEKQLLHTLEGHTDEVISVAFSSDGQTLASSSWDSTVRLWSVSERKPLHTFEGHTSWVMSVAFSGDGQTLASCGASDNMVKLWSVAERKLLHAFEGHTSWVTSVAFSSDDQMLLSSSWDNTVRLWSIAEKRPLHTLEGHTKEVRSVAFSSDGQTLASGSADHAVRLWSIAEKRPLHTFEEHTGEVTSVAFSSDGQTLASGSRDNSVKLWSVDEQNAVHTFEGHTHHVHSVMFSSDGQTLASGGDGTVRLWSVVEKKPLHTFEGHTGFVMSIALSNDGQTLASSSWDNTVRLWSVAEKKALHTFEGHTDWVMSVALSGDGQKLASGSFDKTVRLWSVAEKKALHTFEGHTEGVLSVAFSDDGQVLVSGSYDKTVRLWSITSGQCLTVIQGFNGEVKSVAWYSNAEGDWLATGGADKVVRLWQVHRDGEICRVTLHWASAQAILTAPGVRIQDVIGLSARNTQLLKQRGATGEPHPVLKEKSLQLIEKEETSAFTLPAQVDKVIQSRLAYLDLA